jgi:parallel beta-helix repeat protein
MKAQQENGTGRAGKMHSRLVLLFLFFLLLSVVYLSLGGSALAVSTLTIRDDGTGGDCGSIGVWNTATKTCTLNTDVDVSAAGGIDAIRIVSNGITLDGAGHIINGDGTDGTSSGVYVFSLDGVTIKNIEVGNFSNGIWLLDTSGTTLDSNYLHHNGKGIYASCTYYPSPINPTSNNTIYRNRVTQNSYGIYLDWDTRSNEVTTNLVTGNTTSGIQLSSADDSTVRRNTIRANNTGLTVFGSNNVLVYNNNFDGNTNHASTLSNSISFNQPTPIGGNWWSGWTSPDDDSDGFVDAPYVIVLLNNDRDNLPLVTSTDWYDETAPVISNIQPAATMHTGAVTITANYQDFEPSNGVDVASVAASFTGGPAPWPSLSCTATGSPSGSISCTPSSNLSEGMYYFQVSISDNRGNVATGNGGFWVLPYHIEDATNGSDCESIGSWNAASKTCTLDANFSTAGIDAIHIESDGVTLDGDGHTITGNSGLKVGVLINNRTGVTVRNINANNFREGIYLESSQGCLVEKNGMVNDSDGVAVYYGADNRITGNGFDCFNHNIYIQGSTGNSIIANNMLGHVEGIRLNAATGNLIRGNSLVGTARGLSLVSGANNNTVVTNSMTSMVNFLYFEASGGNTFYSNTFDIASVSPVMYVSGAANIFNGGSSVGGNWWSNYDQPGEGCNDVNSDSFCDAPYTPAAGAGTDYEPWTADHAWQPDYYWTWYDQLSPGALNWVLMANPLSATGDAWFDLTISGEGKALPALEGLAAGQVPPGLALTPTYNGVRGGPVAVNTRPMSEALVSQRTLWAGSSLEEVLGTDANKLSSHFYWTWYDNRSPGMFDWVMISNPGDATIYYRIKLAGAMPTAGQTLEGAASGTIGGGQSTNARFNLKNGPVEVETWSDAVGGSTPANAIASQRVLTNMGTPSEAFNEVPGIPVTELTNDYLWTWYDNVSAGAYDWVLVSNPNGYQINYRITVKGTVPAEMIEGSATGTIAAGANVTPRFRNTINGPVEVKTCKADFVGDTCPDATIADGRSVASQRTIWGPSFEEVPGYPKTALTSDYHWTWYDQKDAGTYNWVHIINTNAFPVYYEITVGGTAPSPVVEGAASGTIAAGELVHPRFLKRGGPVEVRAWTDSGKGTPANVMTSQRVLWHGYFNEVLGTVLS